MTYKCCSKFGKSFWNLAFALNSKIILQSRPVKVIHHEVTVALQIFLGHRARVQISGRMRREVSWRKGRE